MRRGRWSVESLSDVNPQSPQSSLRRPPIRTRPAVQVAALYPSATEEIGRSVSLLLTPISVAFERLYRRMVVWQTAKRGKGSAKPLF